MAPLQGPLDRVGRDRLNNTPARVHIACAASRGNSQSNNRTIVWVVCLSLVSGPTARCSRDAHMRDIQVQLQGPVRLGGCD